MFFNLRLFEKINSNQSTKNQLKKVVNKLIRINIRCSGWWWLGGQVRIRDIPGHEVQGDKRPVACKGKEGWPWFKGAMIAWQHRSVGNPLPVGLTKPWQISAISLLKSESRQFSEIDIPMKGLVSAIVKAQPSWLYIRIEAWPLTQPGIGP